MLPRHPSPHPPPLPRGVMTDRRKPPRRCGGELQSGLEVSGRMWAGPAFICSSTRVAVTQLAAPLDPRSSTLPTGSTHQLVADILGRRRCRWARGRGERGRTGGGGDGVDMLTQAEPSSQYFSSAHFSEEMVCQAAKKLMICRHRTPDGAE